MNWHPECKDNHNNSSHHLHNNINITSIRDDNINRQANKYIILPHTYNNISYHILYQCVHTTHISLIYTRMFINTVSLSMNGGLVHSQTWASWAAEGVFLSLISLSLFFHVALFIYEQIKLKTKESKKHRPLAYAKAFANKIQTVIICNYRQSWHDYIHLSKIF